MQGKIWSRGPKETGGILMMPMRKNVPEGRPGWKLTLCPACGRKCWERPLQEQLIKKGVTTLCTECAIRETAMPDSHLKERNRL